MSTVTICRLHGTRDLLRTYKIILDGDCVGKIADGATTQISVPAGRHQLWFVIDFLSSRVVELDLSADHDAEVYCCSGRRAGFDLDLVRRHDYIQVGAPGEAATMRFISEKQPHVRRWAKLATTSGIVSLICAAVLFSSHGVAVGVSVSWAIGIAVWLASMPLRARSVAPPPSAGSAPPSRTDQHRRKQRGRRGP